MTKRRATQHAIAACICLGLFIWLGGAVRNGRTLPFDVQVREQIHQLANSSLTAGMKLLTNFGSSYWILPCAAAIMLLLWKQGRSNHAVILAAALAGSYFLEYALKLTLGRIRPEPFFGIPSPATFSFPSGHAFFSSAFYGTLAYLTARTVTSRKQQIAIWLSASLSIALICFSRVYLGMHYPTDVMGGVLIACFWINAVLVFAK